MQRNVIIYLPTHNFKDKTDFKTFSNKISKETVKSHIWLCPEKEEEGETRNLKKCSKLAVS